MTRKNMTKRLRFALGTLLAAVCASANAHASISEEAVWFFLAALLAIPVLLVGIVLLIVHLAQSAGVRTRARRAAIAGDTSRPLTSSEAPSSNAGKTAGWMIGGSLALLTAVAVAGGISLRTHVSFWTLLCLVVAIPAVMAALVRGASRRSREARARHEPKTPASRTTHSIASREDDNEPPQKRSNVMLWFSLVLMAIGVFAALSPFYLMHRKDTAAKQAESARAVKMANESQQELDRAQESARNKARIDQMAREMMGEAPPPAPLPTEQEKAAAKRVIDEQRIQCYFYGVFDVEKRGVPYRFTMRADGRFESLNRTDQTLRTGRWVFSSAPNKDGDGNHVVFTYSKGLPATEDERMTQVGSKRIYTENMAGRYDYELLEVLEYPECKDAVRMREFPKRAP